VKDPQFRLGEAVQCVCCPHCYTPKGWTLTACLGDLTAHGWRQLLNGWWCGCKQGDEQEKLRRFLEQS